MSLRIVMDADCLIKLTKAGLKEAVCEGFDITVPELVRREVVDQAPGRPDAARIQDNVDAELLRVAPPRSDRPTKGEDAVLRLYKDGGYDAVATDDTRFIRHIDGLGVPYAVPAVVVVHLRQAGMLTAEEAVQGLDSLRPYISPDEYAVGRLMLSGGTAP